MPAVIPIIAGYGGTVLAAELGAGAYAGLVGAAAAAAAAAAVSAQERKKAKRLAAANRRDLTVMLQTASSARRTVYGRAKLSGPLVYAYSSPGDQSQMHRVIALTGHEVDGYDKVFYNDEDITDDFGAVLPSIGGFSSPAIYGRYITVEGTQTTHVSAYPGTASQTADPVLVAQTGGQWTNDHKLSGCAYVRVQNNYEPRVYTEGLPNPAFVVRGKKVYDNRSGLTQWSDNPALIIRDYLINELGVPAARVDQASFDAAANLCDEYITLDTAAQSDPSAWFTYMANAVAYKTWESVGGTVYRQRRYRFNGVIESDDSPGEVLDGMVSACAGWLSYTGGAWRLVAGGYTAPTLTLGESDLRAGPSFRPRPGRRELYNVARGSYVGPGSNYVATDFPPPNSSALVAADGGQEMPLEVDLPFTNDACAAQRLGSIFLQRSRQGVLVFPATLTALALRPGDTVAINLPRFGFSGEVFRVEGWTLTEDYGIDLILREEAASIYTWSPDATIRDPSPNLNLPSPRSVPAISGLAATTNVATSLVQNDGTIIQRTLLSWNITANAFQRFVEVQVRPVGETAWIPHPNAEDSAGQTYLLNLRTGVQHEIRARRLNTVGVWGAWTTINHTPSAAQAGANLLRNSNWAEDLGYPAGITFYPDARALRGWLYGGNPGQVARNYDSGKTWNIGSGGCAIYIPSNTVGHYAYVYQDVPIAAGLSYEASVYVAIHRANVILYMRFLDSNKAFLLDVVDVRNSGAAVSGDAYNPNQNPRLWCAGVAPPGAAYVQFICLVECTALSAPYPFSAWSNALLCIAPTGVTRATATPWNEGEQQWPRGVGYPNFAEAVGTGSKISVFVSGPNSTITYSGQPVLYSLDVRAGDTLMIECEYQGAHNYFAGGAYAKVATDVIVSGSGHVPFRLTGTSLSGNAKYVDSYWEASGPTDYFTGHLLTYYTAPADQTVTVYGVGGTHGGDDTASNACTTRLRVERVRT
jgi:hypothetical protein